MEATLTNLLSIYLHSCYFKAQARAPVDAVRLRQYQRAGNGKNRPPDLSFIYTQCGIFFYEVVKAHIVNTAENDPTTLSEIL